MPELFRNGPAPASLTDACMADAAGVLVLVATLKGPRLAPSTRLINDLEDQGSDGVSGQQPPPIFRPERASPQGIRGADKDEVGGFKPSQAHQVMLGVTLLIMRPGRWLGPSMAVGPRP